MVAPLPALAPPPPPPRPLLLTPYPPCAGPLLHHGCRRAADHLRRLLLDRRRSCLGQPLEQCRDRRRQRRGRGGGRHLRRHRGAARWKCPFNCLSTAILVVPQHIPSYPGRLDAKARASGRSCYVHCGREELTSRLDPSGRAWFGRQPECVPTALMIMCVLGLLTAYYYLLLLTTTHYYLLLLTATYYFSGFARHLRWRLLVHQKRRGDRKGCPHAAARARARHRPRLAAQPVRTRQRKYAPPAGPACPRPMAHLIAPELSLGRSAALSGPACRPSQRALKSSRGCPSTLS